MSYKVEYKVSYHKGQMFVTPYPSPEFNQFIEYTLIDTDSTLPISSHLPNFIQISRSVIENNRQYTFTLKDGSKTNNMDTPIKDIKSVTIAYIEGHYNSISFQGLDYIETIDKLNVTKHWTSLNETFKNCSNLVSVDASKWDTSNVTIMFDLFAYCTNLKSVKLPEKFVTNKCTNIQGMFIDDINLETVNIENWDVSNVNDIYGIFINCVSLESIDLSSFNTRSTTDDTMFVGCKQSCLVYYNSNLWTLPTSGTGFDVTFIDINSYFTFDLSLADGNTITLVNQDNSSCLTNWGDGTVNSELSHTYASKGTYNVITNLYLGQYMSDDIYGVEESAMALSMPVIEEEHEEVFSDGSEHVDAKIRFQEPILRFNEKTLKLEKINPNEPMVISGDIVKPGYDPYGAKLTIKDMDTTKALVSARLCRVKDLRFYFSMCINMTSVDLTYLESTGDDMSYMFNECRSLKTITGLEDLDVSKVRRMWRTFAFLDTNDVTQNEQTGEFTYTHQFNFNLSKWDVSKLEDPTFMFGGISNLMTLDLTGWNTESLTTMYQMFAMCHSLTEIKGISEFKTDKVTDMYYLFGEDMALTSLDVSKWNTENVTNMCALFYHVSSITSLDLTGWDTSNVTNISFMFYGCHALTNIIGIDNFDTSNVEDMCYLFYHTSVTSLNLSTWVTSKVVDMDGMFAHCSSLTTINGINNFDMRNVRGISGMFNNSAKLNINPSSWKTDSLEDMSGCFMSCSAITSLDLSGWDVSNVTYMQSMFGGCSNLVTLNITGWNPRPNSLYALFAYCNKLTVADVSQFRTDLVVDLDMVFYECNSLQVIDLSNWVVTNVVWAQQFCWYTDVVKVLDVSKWCPINLKYAYGMFAHCPQLEALNTSNWRCPELIQTPTMFSYLHKVKSIDVRGFDMSKVTDMKWMFNAGISLEEIKGIENFKTSNVTTMKEVFDSCGKLTELDLSGWDTSKVTDMQMMFYNNSSLKKLNLDTWNVAKVTNMTNIFYNCKSLEEMHLYNFTKTVKSPSLGDSSMANIPNTTMIFIASNDNIFKTKYPDLYYIYRNEYTVDTSLEYINGVLIDWDKLERTYVTVSGDASVSFVNNFDPENAKSNYLVDWGDGTLDYELNHTYQTPGIYNIKTLNFATDGSYNEYDYFINNNTTARTLNFKVSNYPYSNFDFMCAYMTSLSNLDVTNINTNNSTSMNSMFYNCETLSTTLDVTNWTIDNVNNLSYTFGKCKNLEIVGLENWNTKNLVDSSNLFYYCDKLKSIDLSSWDTSNLKIIDGMFSYCANLESINITNWDSSNLESAHDLFSGCQKLSNLQGITNLVTSKMTNIYQMFYACKELVTLDLSGWDTSNINQIICLFHTCIKLTSIIGIENWNMQNVNNSGSMFYNCAGLKELDLSKWNLNLTNISSTFNGCEGLTKLNISTWDTRNVSGTNNIRWAFSGVPESVDWCYDGTNYINFTLPESQTSFSGTFPWNE